MNKQLQIEPIDLQELEAAKGGCGIANGKCPEVIKDKETIKKDEVSIEPIP